MEPEIDIAEVRSVIAEHLNEHCSNLGTLIVWDGEAVREWAPWEPF